MADGSDETDEGDGWEDEEDHAGYTKDDEEWARENASEAQEREEFESLSRYLKSRAEDKAKQ